jgi:hypothetical protein
MITTKLYLEDKMSFYQEVLLKNNYFRVGLLLI